MARTREAVDAPVLAALVRIDRLIECDVRRLVARNDVLRLVREELRGGLRVRRRIFTPAVIDDLACLRLEAAGRIRQRAATFDDGFGLHDRFGLLRGEPTLPVRPYSIKLRLGIEKD